MESPTATVPERVIRAVESTKLNRRTERLESSIFYVFKCSFAAVALLFTLLFLVLNWRPQMSLIGHLFVSLIGASTFGLVLAGAVYLFLRRLVRVHDRSVQLLMDRGKLIRAELSGPPELCAEERLRGFLKGSLVKPWRRLAESLGRKVPVMRVCYGFEFGGRNLEASELLYRDEVVCTGDDGGAWVLVDPIAPESGRWLAREYGEPAPLVARND